MNAHTLQRSPPETNPRTGMNRRRFLRASAAGSLAVCALPLLGAEGSGRLYRTALFGCGWWGNNILGEAMASGVCRIGALCDVDQRLLARTAERVQKQTGSEARSYRDYRDLLEKEKPEIVIVATPDHWHALQTIAAVQAGAHVYVEKPICHTIREGRAMVKAARAAGRVVQVGTHRRVSPHNVSGREFIRSGKLGKVGMIRAFVLSGGGPEKPLKNSEPPRELDWDLWCGPAPLRPYNGGPDLSNPWRGAIHPRGFRNYLDYANGTLGDWGIHWMDQILWITGEQWPTQISSLGGRPIKGPAVLNAEEQSSDAPDHQVASFKFNDFDVTWEHRQFGGNSAEKGESVGCYFYGTEGTLHLGWKKGWVFYPADSRKEPTQEAPQLHQPDDQNIKELWADFLQAIPTGGRPVSDIGAVQLSTNMALLGMLTYKLGRSVTWDGRLEECAGDAAANRLLSREYRQGWTYPKA
jgi:predicted dehydrogenase